MRITRRHATLGIIVAAALAAGAFLWMKWSAAKRFSDTRSLLARFPAEEALVLNVDFASARRAGLLADSKATLEPEYRQFLDGTGFDYRRDLDSVIASFSASGNFFIARGRFNWPKLREYAAHQGGSCYEQLCRMPGSTPQRRISFLPLRDDTIALAVSTDDLAANRLTREGDPVTSQIPSAPVWLVVPGSALRDPAAFPPGLRLMLSALTNADRLVVTIGLSGTGLVAKMEATCRTKDDARVLASQLRTVTAALKEATQQDRQTSADELAETLAGGTFADDNAHVDGEWRFSKSLIASLTSGI